LIYLALALLPYAFVLSGQVHTGHHFGFILLAMMVVARTINDKYLQWFFYYLAAQCAFIFAGNLFGITTIDQSYRALNYVVHCTAGLIFLSFIVNTKIDTEKIYNIIRVTAVIQCVICLSQYFLNIDPILYVLDNFITINNDLNINKTIPGTFGNRNFVAGYLAISTPFFIKRHWCYFIPFILVVLFLAKTSTAIISLGIGVIVYSRNIYIAAASVFAVLIYSGVYDKISGNVRFENWMIATKSVIKTNPIFGAGPNAGWAKHYLIHNDILSVFLFHGIAGLVLFAGFIKGLIIKNNLLMSALTIGIINSIGSYSMHIAPVALLNITIIGLIIKQRSQQ
jgi:hypothetical protein